MEEDSILCERELAEILSFLHGNQSSMHSLYSNLGWLGLNQQLGVSMDEFKTPPLEKISTKSSISSRIGFPCLWEIITRYL
jgi:hypothetical protein